MIVGYPIEDPQNRMNRKVMWRRGGGHFQLRYQCDSTGKCELCDCSRRTSATVFHHRKRMSHGCLAISSRALHLSNERITT
jgi:hypothetical protein